MDGSNFDDGRMLIVLPGKQTCTGTSMVVHLRLHDNARP
jgi:hypothetical protein